MECNRYDIYLLWYGFVSFRVGLTLYMRVVCDEMLLCYNNKQVSRNCKRKVILDGVCIDVILLTTNVPVVQQNQNF